VLPFHEAAAPGGCAIEGRGPEAESRTGSGGSYRAPLRESSSAASLGAREATGPGSCTLGAVNSGGAME
jgi:hypothetical protein